MLPHLITVCLSLSKIPARKARPYSLEIVLQLLDIICLVIYILTHVLILNSDMMRCKLLEIITNFSLQFPCNQTVLIEKN